MTQFLVEMAVVLFVILGVGYLIGIFYAKARYHEDYNEKKAKLAKIVNEKNEMIVKIKSDLRILQRIQDEKSSIFIETEKALKEKTEQLKLLQANYSELEELIKEIQKDFQMIKHDKELLLKELKEKKQLLKNQDDIIMLLERKIKEVS